MEKRSAWIILLLIALAMLAGCEDSAGPSREEMDLQIAPEEPFGLSGTYLDVSAVLQTLDGEFVADVTGEATWTTVPTNMVWYDPSAGKLRLGNNGFGYLVAQYEGFVDTVNLRSGQLSQLLVDPFEAYLPPGEELAVTCRGVAYISNNILDTLDLTDQVIYFSENPEVAQVGPDGVIHSIGLGSTVVYAAFGNINSGTVVHVAAMDEVTVVPPEGVATVLPGDTLQLRAHAHFGMVAQEVTGTSQWHLENPAAGEFVSGSPGLLVVHAADSVSAWVSYGGQNSLPLALPVKTLLALEVFPQDTVVVGAFETAQFQAVGHFSDGSQSDMTMQVTWLSDNPEAITVSGGVVTPRQTGTADIRAVKSGLISNPGHVAVPGVPSWFESFNSGPIHPWIEEGEWRTEEGQYLCSSLTNANHWTSSPADANFSDFVLEVDVMKAWGSPYNGCGIMIRRSSNLGYYGFTFNLTGNFYVEYTNGWSWGNILAGGYSAAIDTNFGAWNHVAIVADGPQMSFHVNDSLLACVTHGALSEGAPGFYVTNDAAFEYRFDNLAVMPFEIGDGREEVMAAGK